MSWTIFNKWLTRIWISCFTISIPLRRLRRKRSCQAMDFDKDSIDCQQEIPSLDETLFETSLQTTKVVWTEWASRIQRQTPLLEKTTLMTIRLTRSTGRSRLMSLRWGRQLLASFLKQLFKSQITRKTETRMKINIVKALWQTSKVQELIFIRWNCIPRIPTIRSPMRVLTEPQNETTNRLAKKFWRWTVMTSLMTNRTMTYLTL